MPGQVFTLLRWRWDIDAALAAVDAAPREVELVPVRALAQLLGLIRVDQDRVDQADVSQPILLAPYPDDPEFVVTIDGWHRITRALRDGVDELPAYRLTREEADAVRLDPEARGAS